MKRTTEEQIIEHLRSARELCYELELKAADEGDRELSKTWDKRYVKINTMIVNINNNIYEKE
jgi:hypothetical protein